MFETIGVHEKRIEDDLKKVSGYLSSAVKEKAKVDYYFSKTSLLNPFRWLSFFVQQRKFFSVVLLLFLTTFLTVYSLEFRVGVEGSTFFTLFGCLNAVGLMALLAWSGNYWLSNEFMSRNVFAPFYKIKVKEIPKVEVEQSKNNKHLFIVKNKQTKEEIMCISYSGTEHSEVFQDFLLKLDQIVSDVNNKVFDHNIMVNSTFSQLDNIKQASTSAKDYIKQHLKSARYYDTRAGAITFALFGVVVATGALVLIILHLLIVSTPIYDKETFHNVYTQNVKIDKILQDKKRDKPATLQDVKREVEDNLSGKYIEQLRNVEYCEVWGEGIKHYTVQFNKKATADSHYSYTISMKDGRLTPKSSSQFDKTNCVKTTDIK